MRKSKVQLVLPLSLAGLLVACSGGEGSGTTAQNAPEFEPDADGSVSVGFLLEPEGLDPTSVAGAALDQLVIDNVYEGLTFRDQDGNIHPKLAKSWDVSEDGLTYTFHLEEGVTFHDGSSFDSQDVVSTLEASAAEGSTNPDAKLMGTFDSATVVDEHTVEVTLSSPNANFLDTMATDAAMMIPSDNTTDLNRESNGTGPYTIGEWKTGESIQLVRNDGYWGEPAKNAEAVFRYYQDQAAAANGLASGEIDVLTTYNNDTVERFANDPSIVAEEGSQASWMTLGFNHQRETFKDQRVRQAIRMAIDKKGLIAALGDTSDATGSMIAPGQAWWDPSLTEIQAYNPEQARALLDEAGVENLTVNLRVANTYESAVSEYIQAQLAAVGITVELDQVEFPTWLEEVYQGRDYDMTMVLHVDPWTLTYYANPEYYWGYDNAEVQRVIKDALATPDLEARDEGLAEAARLISEDAASDWLYVPKALTYANEEVRGYPISRTGSRYPVYNIEVAQQ